VKKPRVNPGWIGPWKRTTKWCPGCERQLPFDAFRQQFTTSSWLSSWCRQCLAAANRRWRERNPAYVEAANAARREGPFPKVCPGCGEEFFASRRRQTRCPECQPRHRQERKR